MGEIDTKPIESVQSALSLFGEKSFKKGCRSNSTVKQTTDKEVELMQKELTNYKMQMEIREAAHMETFLQLEVYYRTFEELAAQLYKSEAQKEKYKEEVTKANTLVELLKSENKDSRDRLLDYINTQEELKEIIKKLTTTQEELRLEQAACKEAKLTALRQFDELEASFEVEKRKTEELRRHVSELNEAIFISNLTAIEAEKEKTACLLAKDERILTAQNQFENLKRELDSLRDLETQLSANSVLAEFLQSELKLAKEHALMAIQESEKLNLEIQLKDKRSSEKEVYIRLMELELAKTQEVVQNLREEVDSLNNQIDSASNEMKRLEDEVELTEKRESDAQAEIGRLKAEKLILEIEVDERSSEKEVYIHSMELELAKAQEDVQNLREEVDRLNNQIDSDSSEIKRLENEVDLMGERESEAQAAIAKLKLGIEWKDERSSEKEVDIHSIELEMAKAQEDVLNLREEVDNLNSKIDSASNEIKRLKNEVGLTKERESEAQTEIARLKAEVHRARSKIASLEADEAKAQYVKSGLYLAVQELAIEAEEAKREAQKLKEMSEGASITISIDEYEWLVKQANSSNEVDLAMQELAIEAEEAKRRPQKLNETSEGTSITISIDEYEWLVKQANNSNAVDVPEEEVEWGNVVELDEMKKELKAAKEEIEKLRNDVDEARKTVEVSDEAKRRVEEQLRRYREKQQKRRAAIAALKEESRRWVSNPSAPEEKPGSYQPLGKVLNMKF